MANLNVKVGLDRAGFQTGLAAMENAVQGFGGKVSGILAGSFSFAAIGAGLARAINQGDQLQDLANRFGVAASAIQEIGNAASLSGGSVEDVAAAMNKLARNAGEAIGGNKQMAESFARIGLSTEQLMGMSPQDLFFALSRSVSSGALGMEDFAVASDLAGRGAATLMETLRMGPEAIQASGRAMGTWSDETIAALSRASDQIKSLQNVLTVAFGNAAGYILPVVDYFKMLAEQAGFAAAAVAEALQGNFGNAMTIAAAAKREREKRPEQKPVTPSAGPRGDQKSERQDLGSAAKDEERSKQEILRAEEQYRKAVRDRETRSLDAVQQIGRAEAELVALQAQASALADGTAQKFESLAEIERKRLEILDLQNEAKADGLRLAEDEARAADRLAQTKRSMEDIEAERQGETTGLLRRRAQEAIQKANETGMADDRLAALEARRDFEEAKQREIEASETFRFFGGNARAEARAAGDALGKLNDATFTDPKAQDGAASDVLESTGRVLTNLTDAAAQAKAAGDAWQALSAQPLSFEDSKLQDLLGNIMPAFRPMGADLSDTAGLGMQSKSEGPKAQTVEDIRNEVKQAVDKLDALIRASGTFSL